LPIWRTIDLAQPIELLSILLTLHFQGVRVTQPEGGYFLWVELPPGLNALELQRLALFQNISIAPGQLFSADQRFSHFIRLNFGHPSAAQLEPALKTLGRLVHALAP
jgi:DNA-binding transcriptional MocR family regulator